jgi:hypothetical protein
MTTPSLLFKYAGSAPHHLDILRNLLIRFTQPDDLNDPHDCIPGIMPPADIGSFVDAVIERWSRDGGLAGLSQQARIHARNTLVALYEADPAALVERCFAVLQQNINQVGVLSLTTGNENLVLWAHYADNHRGFVVGFQPGYAPMIPRPGEMLGEGELRPVVYGSARVVVPIDEIALAPDTLFQKHERWSSEDEWRVVRQLAHCDVVLEDGSGADRYFLCAIDPVGVTRVDIGESANDETVQAILEVTSPGTPLAHVQVYRARMNAGRTGFMFQPLK